MEFRFSHSANVAAENLCALVKKKTTRIDIRVGNRVRIRRTLLGMSQEELGNRLGVTFQQVRKYEKGLDRIGAGCLFEIARALSVPVEFFYGNPRQAGVPEGDAAPAMEMFLSSGEGLQLSLAFMKIKDFNVRRQVLNLVSSLGKDGASQPH